MEVLFAALLGVIFSDGFESPECPGPDMTRQEVVLVRQTDDATTYEDIWDIWGRSSSTRHISVFNNRYAALPFTVPLQPDDAFALLIWDQIFESPETVRISVSRCDGPPDPDTSYGPGCYFEGNGVSGGFNMKLVGENPSNACIVAPGDELFFVFEFVCPRTICFWNVSEN